MTRDEIEVLLVKVVDGVATPAEREALMRLALADPALRRELEAHQALKAVTDGWVARLEHDLALDRVERAPLARAEAGLGLTLLALSTALLTGGTLFAVWTDPEAPLWLRLGLSVGAAGLALLLVAVARWRWRVAASDPYARVVR